MAARQLPPPPHVLYVVSPEKPDFSHLNETVGWQNAPGQSLDYTKFTEKVQTGTQWLFRLQINPTKSLHSGKQDSRTRGKIIPLITDQQQIDWLQNRAAKLGFEIPSHGPEPLTSDNDSPQIRVVENRELRFVKVESDQTRRTVTLRKSVLEGKLIVTDELALRSALLNGVGRAKSYGFGLLTLRQ